MHSSSSAASDGHPKSIRAGACKVAFSGNWGRGWVSSRWETAPDRNREFKYYRLTEKGRKQLVVEESQWKLMADAVARVMWPAAEES
jgi:hypothetical protein